jgi:hypothetical protein
MHNHRNSYCYNNRDFNYYTGDDYYRKLYRNCDYYCC